MYARLKPGFIVKIKGVFYQVTEVEPFQYETGEESTAIFSSSVASGSTGAFTNVTDLEPDSLPVPHLFWVVPGVEDGMRYYFKIPTGTNRFGTDVTKDIGFVDNTLSPHYAPNENYGFWLIHEYYPSVAAKNVMGVAITPKVHFRGYKYALKQLNAPPMNQPVQEITIGGLSS